MSPGQPLPLDKGKVLIFARNSLLWRLLYGLLLLLCFNGICNALPQVKHFFPNRGALLGKPLVWTIRIQYPVWEAYRVTVPPCEGLETKIEGPDLSEKDGQVTAYYRIQMLPQSLSIADVPSAFITDQKGQSTVISGKAIVVQSISGDSLQIKNPPPLPTPLPGPNRFWLLGTLTLLFGALIFLIIRRILEKSPRRLLIRNLIRARTDIQKGRMPLPIWRLLRSELLWGFSAETYTPSQLKEIASHHPQLTSIANSLISLEAWRYSNANASWDPAVVLQSIESAITIAGERKRQTPGVQP